MRPSLFRLLSLFLLLAALSSCGSGQSENVKSNKGMPVMQSRVDDFSSPKSLFVDYISSYTGGVVSRTSSIRLQLAKPAGDSLAGNEIQKEVFEFSPAIKGSAFWADNRTVVFQPEAHLPSSQEYEATVHMDRLISDIQEGKEEFRFKFQTLVQNYEVSVEGLQLYSKNDLKRVKLGGKLQTADYAAADDIKKLLSASQDGKALNMQWKFSGEDNVYDFVIEEVARKEQEGKVELSLNGEALGIEKKESLEVKVPSLGDYKVVSSKIVRGQDNYISVMFSDPLDEKQNFRGLVFLEGIRNKPRVVVNLNELKIYPTQEINTNTKLTIDKHLKNRAGFKLKEDFITQLQFTQRKPEVKLVDSSEKAILPNSNGLILPFEAVGLSAVDVTIIKVFEDNMLQYLQVNSLGRQSQMRRVARPVGRKTIPLNTSGVTNLNTWNRYTLNLEDIIKTEPGAVYQVSIGFRKKHSLYFCAENENIEQDTEVMDDDWGAEEEASYWDGYENYYNSNYNWQERDNPCSDSYYGKRRAKSKILFASDMGIIAKKRDGGDLHVFVSNLIDTKPMAGVQVEVYDYQQQLIGKGETGSVGKGEIKIKGQPFALIARKDKQIGYLKLDDGSALSLSNFDITGTQIQNGLKGYLYSERGVWRPADTVHIGFMLEDAAKQLPEQHPVSLEMYNPQGQLYARKISSEAVGNIYRFDIPVEESAPTGNWTAKAKVGGAQFNKTVKIETIKPNRLKVELEFGTDKFTYDDRNVNGDLKVRWLSGAKAGNLKAEYDLVLSPVKTTFKNYGNFSFDDESKEFYSKRETVFEGRLDNEGSTQVNIDLGEAENAPGALQAHLLGKVYEEGGDFSISNVSIPYYPYSSFVGIQTPEGDKRGILLTDKEHSVRIVTLDANGKKISRSNLKVELYKLNWKWWWDNSYDNISNYVGRSYRDPIQKATIYTQNGEGRWNLRINYPDWGRYYLRVEDPVSGHSAGKIVYLDWPGWAGKGKRGGMSGATMLDFGIEKEEYKVGEKIALSIPSTKGNRILVSLESGSEVLETFWVDAEDENTSIAFDATSEMSPNVYVHLTMVQPHAQEKNDLPIRLYGVQSVKVVDPSTELKPVIQMPEELRPEQTYTVKVSEANKKAMAYTIAVVDEGLLDITNFKTPNPWSTFYAREALGIKTWDVYDDVMGAYTGKIERLLAIGGDGELKEREDKETNRFKPVVEFLGPFYLKAGKTATHKLTMPQYIGSVKTMVVASSNGAYGSTDQVTPVKQPVMVMATLPRVAGPSESMKLPVNVFVLEDNIKEVKIKVETTGALSAKGSTTKTVRFNKAGDEVIYFDLQAAESLGTGKVKVTATSGSMTATYDVALDVLARNPETSDVDDRIVNAGEHWTVDYKPLGIEGKNTAAIELSTLPPLNIEQRLQYLVQYPHGCVEQTTSSVFAQLYLDQLIDLPEEKRSEVQRNVEAAIKRLSSFQISTGGFAYWPGNAYPNNWGTNYAGHFLIEAKKKGYNVPESMISNWISYQTEKAEAWGDLSDDSDTDLVQAYRLYTLAKAENPALGAMNRMKEKTTLSQQAKWRLALAYAVAGYDQQAISLIEGLTLTPESPNTNRHYTFGSQTRDQAMILETLLALDKKTDSFEMLQKVAKEMGDTKRWMSTQTTAYCFIALSKYTESFPIDGEVNAEIVAHDQVHKMSGDKFIHQLKLKQSDKPAAVHIKNKGETPVFARLIRTGVALEGQEKAAENGLKLNINYKTLDGQSIAVDKIEQGTNFIAEVTVVNPGMKGKYEELALTQIFPSGWEIINTRLEGTEESLTSDVPEYKDIRDDRVMHYFDLEPNKQMTFRVLLNAAYQGKYYLPTVAVEAMYDHSVYARQTGKWVEVYAENGTL